MFTKLRFNVNDVYQPAAEQFDGRGSYGNGSAMRVTPAALFAYKNNNTLIEVTPYKTYMHSLGHGVVNGYAGGHLFIVGVLLVSSPHIYE